jgi:hypothetical protein
MNRVGSRGGCDGSLTRSIVSVTHMFVARTVAAFGIALLLLAVGSGSAASAASCPNAAARIGLSGQLPDCRAFEQVSPTQKNGWDVPTVSVRQFPTQSSPSGESVAFMSFGAFAGSQGNGLPDAYIASRGSGSWQTASVTPPQPDGPPSTIAEFGYAYNFSTDLSQVVLKVPYESLAPTGEEATPGAYNLFLRNSDGRYALVTAASPSTAPSACVTCFEEEDVPVFAGANAGGGGVAPFTHVLFEVNESLLTTPAVSNGQTFLTNLYESNMGQPSSERVHPVGILPDGTIANGGSVAGSGLSVFYSTFADLEEGQSIAHAISADGSHVLFQATADEGAPDPAQTAEDTELYDRVDGSSTIEVSAPAPGATPANATPESATFWAASADGSVVFFTSKAELTSDANTGPANEGDELYRYELPSLEHPSGELTDVTAGMTDSATESLEDVGGNVLGVVGSSEDGSYVYFVADGQLAGAGKEGEPNLYVAHEGHVSFVATLSPSDEHVWGSDYWQPGASEAYVTPDGRHLAFTSMASVPSVGFPSGYDNVDPANGEVESEVYEYSADSGSIVCASCDQTGATPTASASIAVVSNPYQRPRVLNDEGSRLFFFSKQPVDGSATAGLFEYEEGHASLIDASGIFLDASANGDNVFFATREQLTNSDRDELEDVYDARVDGEPPVTTTTTTCESNCQGSPSPAPESATPASAQFVGPGNPAPATAVVKPKPTAAQVRAANLAKALKACKHKAKSKRKRCEVQARKRYGTKAKSKATKTSRRAK